MEALWQIKRIGNPTLSPDGRVACASGHVVAMDTNESRDRAVAVPDGPGRGPGAGSATATRARRLTAGDKDSEPRWSPDGKWIAFTAKRKDDAEPQVYRIAPDGGEAERVTKIATGAPAIKWFPDSRRIAFVSWVWPDLTRRGAGEAPEGAQGRQGQGARRPSARPPLLGPLADRRPRTARVRVRRARRGRCRDLLAGTGLALPPWEPTADHYDISPDGRELALTVDPDAEPAIMNRATS